MNAKKVDFKLFWAHLYSKNSQKITQKWVKLPYKALELSWTLFPANFSYTPKKYGYVWYFFTKTTFPAACVQRVKTALLKKHFSVSALDLACSVICCPANGYSYDHV